MKVINRWVEDRVVHFLETGDGVPAAVREFAGGSFEERLERRMTMQTTEVKKMKRRSIWYLAASALTLIATLIVVTAAAGSETHVLQVPGDYPTIQAAVNAATEGDTIMVAAGVYQENVVVTTSDLRLHAANGVVLDGAALGGFGIFVHGTSATARILGVEVSGFEIRNFTDGLVSQFASGVQLHHNDLHDNEAPAGGKPGLGIAVGIDLRTTADSEVTENLVHHNGGDGIEVRVGSTGNTIKANHIYENGTQYHESAPDAAGIVLTGAGTNDNRIEENEVLRNNGRGIVLTRPVGAVPITRNLVLQNRAHDNQRAGIAIMFAATQNYVWQNDARDNNLSGLPPCVHCNLLELSTSDNFFERNLGTFNVTDPACLIP